MKGMMGMRGIRVGMLEIRVGMLEIRVGMQEMRGSGWKCGELRVGMKGIRARIFVHELN